MIGILKITAETTFTIGYILPDMILKHTVAARLYSGCTILLHSTSLYQALKWLYLILLDCNSLHHTLSSSTMALPDSTHTY